MKHARQELGSYSAHSGYVQASLALKADFDDGHINPARGLYYADFSFSSTTDGSHVELGYIAYGFIEIFSKLKPLAPSIDSIVKEQNIPAANFNSGHVYSCIKQLEEQTKLLGTINELPPTPMCR